MRYHRRLPSKAENTLRKALCAKNATDSSPSFQMHLPSKVIF